MASETGVSGSFRGEKPHQKAESMQQCDIEQIREIPVLERMGYA
ncbi:MAG: hypothetical protein R2725_13500 [Solirubrobacterales bacterium]